MTAAAIVLAISIAMLLIGGVLAYSWGGGEGFVAYVGLFLLSQVSWLLVLIGAVAVLFLGTDKMKAGVWAFAIYWFVSFVLGLLILMPYLDVTFFPI